jgi:hypothetical protein
MIKLKQEVNKSEIMRELKAEAEIAFENTWQKEMKIQAYMNGAHDLFKKLCIAHVSGELADFSRFLSEEYSIEIPDRIINEWNKYYSANYR